MYLLLIYLSIYLSIYLFIYLFVYLFIYRSFNDVLSNSGYKDSKVSMIVHNGLENISGPVIVQVLIVAFERRYLRLRYTKNQRGFPSISGFPVSLILPNLANIIDAEQAGMPLK